MLLDIGTVVSQPYYQRTSSGLLLTTVDVKLEPTGYEDVESSDMVTAVCTNVIPAEGDTVALLSIEHPHLQSVNHLVFGVIANTIREKLPGGSSQDINVSKLPDGTIQLGSLYAKQMFTRDGLCVISALSMLITVLERVKFTVDGTKVSLILNNNTGAPLRFEYDTDTGELTVSHQAFTIKASNAPMPTVNMDIKGEFQVTSVGNMLLNPQPPSVLRLCQEAASPVRTLANTTTCPTTQLPIPITQQPRVLA